MAQYNFEGDFGNVTQRQLEFINQVVLDQNLKVNKVVFEPVGKAGDNFIANVKRIKLDGDNGSLQLIVKVAPTHEQIRTTTNTEVMFHNEIVMYAEVLPKLVQLQKDAGVPDEEQLKFAKCYGAYNDAPNEVLILEDLCVSNFTMLNKFEALSDECVKSILKNFAILHSLSYVLKEREPETYNSFKSKLLDAWVMMAENKDFCTYMEIFENEIAALFEEEKYKNLFKNKVTDTLPQSIELSSYEVNNKYAVIQQGDAWTNNIMFRFEGDKLAQSIMIDYQASKYSSPAMDILYMIFNCTDHESRSKNFYAWLDYYHSELDKSLSNFGLKANICYPRDQLDADLKRYSKLLFGMSLILGSVLMRDTDEAAEVLEVMKKLDINEAMKSIKMQDLQSATKTRVRTRIIGLIDSYKEFGLL